MTEQERFEQFMYRIWKNPEIEKSPDGEYKNDFAHFMWTAWQAARRWIPVSESLPEEDQIVWIYDSNSHIGPMFECISIMDEEWLWSRCYEPYWYKGEWKANDIELDDLFPTHWQPLPEPPEDV